MPTLNEVLARYNSQGGKLWIKEGDIDHDEDGYFDWRFVRNKHNFTTVEDDFEIEPIAKIGRSYYFVCPACGRIEMWDKDVIYNGRIITCNKTNYPHGRRSKTVMRKFSTVFPQRLLGEIVNVERGRYRVKIIDDYVERGEKCGYNFNDY